MDDYKLIEKIVDNIEQVVIGKKYEVYQIIKGILAGGHILIEDVPGVGKTTLVKALSKTLDLSCSRIQFTPDLMPSDILGVSIYNQKTQCFEYKKGPVFANLVLADEINRTSPKTQSALLEVMEERQISEGNNTYYLKKPFIVIATQNPVEYEGTYRLPEAQLDRFMIRIWLGYADEKTESNILQTYKNHEPIEEIQKVASSDDIIMLQSKVRNVHVSKSVTDYIAAISKATRENKYISLGASTRASMSLLRIAQSSAVIAGRDYVTPEDIKGNANAVYAHRLILSPSARAENIECEPLLRDILDRIPVSRGI